MQTQTDDQVNQLAARTIQSLRDAGAIVAVVESLTSGRLAELLGCAPGSGDVFTGGLVAYSRTAKARILGISPDSVVDEPTALAMAQRGRALFDVDLCVSLTGVAGPEAQDDQPVGTVFIGWASPTDSGVDLYSFDGDPDHIRARSCAHALRRLCSMAPS